MSSFPSFRKSFHSEQVDVAREAETQFLHPTTRYVFLNADVQSGKTGAFQCLIRMMLRSGMVERAYILCGSSETTLQAQARADTAAYNGDYLKSGLITVLFRQQFAKHRMATDSALIVVDESHMDQDVSQKLAEFLAAHGLAMDGTRPSMIERNTYMLSVDATGYSEMAAIRHGKSRGKAIVHLKPGKGYVGPKQYFETRQDDTKTLLRPTFSIQSDPDAFLALFRPRTWNLMRIAGGKKERKEANLAAIRTMCEAAGIRVYVFTSAKEEVAISCPCCEGEDGCTTCTTMPCLSHAPEQPSLVLLDGRLRAGKVVPKQHIGFVWEGGKHSSTDAVIQGLFGRMCGYSFGAVMPQVFIPAALLRNTPGKEVEWCEIQRHIEAHQSGTAIPTKATNLVGAVNPKRAGEDKTVCPPVRLSLSEEAEWLEEDAATNKKDRELIIKQSALDALRADLSLVRAHPTLSEEQKAEIETGLVTISAEDAHIRLVGAESAKSQHEYVRDLVVSHRTHTIPTSQHISDFPFLTFVAIKSGFRVAGVHAGDVFAVFYTKAKGTVESTPARALMSDVRKKCAFISRELPTAHDAVAAASLGFAREQVEKPAALVETLRSYIRHQTTLSADGFLPASIVQFVGDVRVFYKSAYAYKSPADNALITCLKPLGDELGLKFKVKFVKGGTREKCPFFGVESISWKA